jgi:hypothetical protein
MRLLLIVVLAGLLAAQQTTPPASPSSQPSQEPVEDTGLTIPVSVHPDLEGYALMARTVCRSLSSAGVIAPPSSWRWERLGSDQQYFARAGLDGPALARIYETSVLPLLRSGKDREPELETFYRGRIRQLRSAPAVRDRT